MNKTKIEWCDMTWNPVTGCLQGCEYCYARRMAQRFGGNEFAPAFHSYRLAEPQSHKKPQNVFVCSMADLFGEWVPDEWIEQVFAACEKAPQHRYLFLTKNPKRYELYHNKHRNELGHSPIRNNNFWFGFTKTRWDFGIGNEYTRFLSIEPIQTEIRLDGLRFYEWVIIGAETGNRKDKVIPKLEWIESIVADCQKCHIPVFMKDSLKGIWQGELVREFPWGDK
jgi:protein gp37